ncbi:MAG: tetratricopeptide repeat protein, partial [Anaerolineales bacterium]|nr:tetratricopeptide repeat protein [Anaerolineales bacterium]
MAAAVEFADSIAEFLDVFGRWRERDALLARVAAPLAGGEAGERSAAITKAEFLLQSRQGETLLQQGQAQQAEALFRALLARLAAGAAYDADYDIAMTQARLGRCLAAQGRPGQAIAWHQKAIAGFERLSQGSKSAKEMLGRVYPDLGDNLAAIGRFAEAQEAYENSLTICR